MIVRDYPERRYVIGETVNNEDHFPGKASFTRWQANRIII